MNALCLCVISNRDFVAHNLQGLSARWIGFINQILKYSIRTWMYSRWKYDRYGDFVYISAQELETRSMSVWMYIQLAICLTFSKYPQGAMRSIHVLLKFFPRLLELPGFFIIYKKVYYEMHSLYVTLLRGYFEWFSTIFSNINFCMRN